MSEKAFKKTRYKNRMLYLNKQFCDRDFEQFLLNRKSGDMGGYTSRRIPSSEFSRVYKLDIPINGHKKSMYLKHYCHRSFVDVIKHAVRASRAKRAFNACISLGENSFNTADIVGYYESRLGPFIVDNVLVTKEIENARAILEVFKKICNNKGRAKLSCKRDLIRSFGSTIGQLHRKGFFHGDLRLGNILAKDDDGSWRFFFLDNERTKRYRKLSERHQIKNLVQINLFREELSDSDRMRFFREYWSSFSKDLNKGKALARKVLRKTEQRMHKKMSPYSKMRKYFRTNSKYRCVKTKVYRGMFDRAFYEESLMSQFIPNIDLLMDNGEILKNGDNTYVSRCSWSEKDIVVKRYNYRGFINSLRHMVKGSRARRCWGNAHRLLALNVATPKPIAYFEKRRSGILWKSYLVTEYVAGQNLHSFLRDNNVTEQQRSIIIGQVEELLDILGGYRITHGDLKHTNILITTNGPVLTDLDGMKVHRLSWMYKFRRQKDITNF